jgi:hypothetical protein
MVDALLIKGLEAQPLRRGECLRLSCLATLIRASGFTAEVLDRSLMEWSPAETTALLSRLQPALVVLDCFRVMPHVAIAFANQAARAAPDAYLAASGLGSLTSIAPLLGVDSPFDAAFLGEREQSVVDVLVALLRGGDLRVVRDIVFPGDRGPAVNPMHEESDPELGPVCERDKTPEYGLFAGFIQIRAARRPAMLAPDSQTARQPRQPKQIAAEVEAVTRASGVRRFLITGLEGWADGESTAAWLRTLGRELNRRDLDIHLGLSAATNVLDPDLLPSLRAAGLQTLMVHGDPYEPGACGRFHDRAHVIALARELRLTVYPDFCLFTPAAALEDLRADVASLRQFLVHSGGSYLFFGRGNGREFLLMLRSASGTTPGREFYDPRVGRVFEWTTALFERCFEPLYRHFRMLLRYVLMLRRDARERLLQQLDGQLLGAMDRLRGPALDLIELLIAAAAGERTIAGQDALMAADEATGLTRDLLGQFTSFAIEQGLTRGLRFLPAGGRVFLGVADEIATVPEHPLTADLTRLYNHLPRTTVLVRLARRAGESGLEDLYDAFAEHERRDSVAALDAPPRAELPGEILA